MPQLVGKMHPLLRLGFNRKRVNADITSAAVGHDGNGVGHGQVIADNLSAALLGKTV